jgi:hypothetical protein
LQIVISCNLRYFANSFVVMICGIIKLLNNYFLVNLLNVNILYLFIIPKTNKVNKKLPIVNKNTLSLYI